MTTSLADQSANTILDYTPLHTQLRHNRSSPLAVLSYSTTFLSGLVTLLLWVNAGSINNSSYPWFIFGATIFTVIAGLSSYTLSRRTSISKPIDLLAFAESNAMTVTHNPLLTSLTETVRIMCKYGSFYPPNPWYFAVDLTIQGVYRNNAIALHNLIVAIPSPSNSTIEEDMQTAYDEKIASEAAITLTMRAYKIVPVRRGVVIWSLPDISLQNMKSIQELLNSKDIISDVQTDGKQLAILLTTTIPYDRDNVINLFQLLDRVHDLANR